MLASLTRLRGVAIAAVAVFGAGAVASCDDAGRSQAAAPRQAFAGSEIHHFSDLSEMVRTVDLVVVGSVRTTGPGRVVGPPGEEVQYREMTVDVAESWRGSPPDPTLIVETLDSQPYGFEWRVPGEEVLVFLTKGDPRPDGGNYYFPTNSQSVFLVDGEDLRATNNDPFHAHLAEFSKSELRDRVRRN